MAPRSYWKLTPRWPSGAGIIQDYQDVLRYALRRFPQARIVLYGHSLGGAAAICTLAQLEEPGVGTRLNPDFDRIRGLILESPFSSIPAMVPALYPQNDCLTVTLLLWHLTSGTTSLWLPYWSKICLGTTRPRPRQDSPLRNGH